MPKNPEIKKVLVIGSGPIVIGQAAEFDYALAHGRDVPVERLAIDRLRRCGRLRVLSALRLSRRSRGDRHIAQRGKAHFLRLGKQLLPHRLVVRNHVDAHADAEALSQEPLCSRKMRCELVAAVGAQVKLGRLFQAQTLF